MREGGQTYMFACWKQARVVAHSRCSVKGGGFIDALPGWSDPFSSTMCGFHSGPSFSSLESFVVAERAPGCVSSSFLSHPFRATYDLTDVLRLQLAVSQPGKCPQDSPERAGTWICHGHPFFFLPSLSQPPFCLSPTIKCFRPQYKPFQVPHKGRQSARPSPETLKMKATNSGSSPCPIFPPKCQHARLRVGVRNWWRSEEGTNKVSDQRNRSQDLSGRIWICVDQPPYHDWNDIIQPLNNCRCQLSNGEREQCIDLQN